MLEISYIALNDIADFFFQMFGDGIIMAFFVVMFFLVLLWLLKVNIATILIVILPLILGLAFNKQVSNLIEVSPWVYWVLLLTFGLIAGGVIVVSAMRN
ncbi:hypothetical protein LCGC14_1228390 [marine sediment metagenome]|uniref:Uncharacterized protein n=1 Tax=marine sediment metagenome TaxID=412755 RepID=A0A0F9LWE1_9ZZZZ